MFLGGTVAAREAEKVSDFFSLLLATPGLPPSPLHKRTGILSPTPNRGLSLYSARARSPGPDSGQDKRLPLAPNAYSYNHSPVNQKQ